MNLEKYNLDNSVDVEKMISDLDNEIKMKEYEILDGKTEEEQRKIKKIWNDNKIKQEKELNKIKFETNKIGEKSEKEIESLKKLEKETVSGIKDMVKKMDEEFDKMFSKIDPVIDDYKNHIGKQGEKND